MPDIVRAGYISAVDYEKGMAQVTYRDRDNATSPYMPLCSNEYNMPEIDTLVYVLHLPSCSARGMILVPPYTEMNLPPEGREGIWRKDFGDGSYIRYDYREKSLEIECGSLSISGDVHIKGNLTVDGSYPG